MKKYIDTIIVFLVVVIMILGIAFWLESVEKRIKKNNKQKQKIIKNCLKRPDRRVETVGSVLTGQYLICNPK